jgi:hypothetical protein
MSSVTNGTWAKEENSTRTCPDNYTITALDSVGVVDVIAITTMITMITMRISARGATRDAYVIIASGLYSRQMYWLSPLGRSRAIYEKEMFVL